MGCARQRQTQDERDEGEEESEVVSVVCCLKSNIQNDGIHDVSLHTCFEIRCTAAAAAAREPEIWHQQKLAR